VRHEEASEEQKELLDDLRRQIVGYNMLYNDKRGIWFLQTVTWENSLGGNRNRKGCK
jgi:hypothetical protein